MWHSWHQFSSVTQSCATLCDPMNRSTPGLPVHHHLPEFTQTRVPQVSDAIQPSHPLSSPSPPAPNPSQHQKIMVVILILYYVLLCLVTQSWLIFCNPMDCSPPGSSVLGDSPGKNTGVRCHALLQGNFQTQESKSDL